MAHGRLKGRKALWLLISFKINPLLLLIEHLVTTVHNLTPATKEEKEKEERSSRKMHTQTKTSVIYGFSSQFFVCVFSAFCFQFCSEWLVSKCVSRAHTQTDFGSIWFISSHQIDVYTYTAQQPCKLRFTHHTTLYMQSFTHFVHNSNAHHYV